MPRNPHYDANWRQRLDAAQAALTAAQAASNFAGPEAMAAVEAARAAWRAQFETVADYAAWRFSRLAAAKDGFALDHDAAEFATIEAVESAYENAARDAREGTLERRFRLQTDQPPELAAFAEGSGTISSWRRFGEIDCMVSFCLADGLIHICLAHPWGGLALKSNEIFRTIATQLARETILLQRPGAAVVFTDDGHKLARHRELIRQVNGLAAQCRFYRHLLPERGLREEFCRVDMVWNGASWIDPDWSAVVYDRLPRTLREAAGQPASPLLPGQNFALD